MQTQMIWHFANYTGKKSREAVVNPRILRPLTQALDSSKACKNLCRVESEGFERISGIHKSPQ